MLNLGLMLIAIPAALIAFVPRRWVIGVLVAWPLAPLAMYIVLLLLAISDHPEARHSLGSAAGGFVLAAALFGLPWLATCLLGFGLGFLLRRFRRASRPASAPEGALPWRAHHVGLAHDELAIGGVPVWAQGWREVPMAALSLPHPSYPQQRHRFQVYEIGPPEAAIRFAAGEVSNMVWAFYLPTPTTPASPRFAAWRSALAILAAALLAIAGATWLSLSEAEPPSLATIPPPPTPKP